MKTIPTLFLMSIMLNITPSYGEKALPDFSQYKVKTTDVMKGKPKPVDLSSYKGAKTYRTKLREGAKAGPNFAGHYTIVTYGCGTQCQDNWVIDERTGKIIDRFESAIGSKYQLDSDLLIVNPPDPDLKKAYEEHPEQPILGDLETTYKVLKNGKFDVVHKTKWVDVN